MIEYTHPYNNFQLSTHLTIILKHNQTGKIVKIQKLIKSIVVDHDYETS